MTPLPAADTPPKKRPRKVTPARWAAWHVIRRTFDDDAWTDRAFTSVAEQHALDPRERAFAQRLAYGTVQQAKKLDHVIGLVGKRPLAKVDPPVLHALRLGLYELLELGRHERPDDESAILIGGSTAYAAVDQAVELVRSAVGERAVAFTNAVLRRAQVDAVGILDRLDPDDDADLAVLLSMPEWLVRRVRARHGQVGIDALAAQSDGRGTGHGTPFRINAAHPDAATVDRRLGDLARASGGRFAAGPAELVPDARTLSGSTAPAAALVEEGLLVPQSLASQLVTLALAPEPGEVVVDLCAAPGGKTTHIASLLGDAGTVHAVDLHPHRVESIVQLAQRTRTTERVVAIAADATAVEAAQLGGGEPADRVLVDAPCSGTGVLAGRPDSRWKRTEAGLDELVELQRALLASAARLVRPGGIVVYSTCSILAEEDEDIAAAAPAGLVPDPLPTSIPGELRVAGSEHVARTWPHLHGTDGFFIARFRREPEGEPS